MKIIRVRPFVGCSGLFPRQVSLINEFAQHHGFFSKWVGMWQDRSLCFTGNISFSDKTTDPPSTIDAFTHVSFRKKPHHKRELA